MRGHVRRSRTYEDEMRSAGRWAVAEAIGPLTVLVGDVALLGGVFGEVVELVAVARRVEDVFEIAVADAKKIFVGAAEETGTMGMRGAHQAVALPGGGEREVQKIKHGWSKIDVRANRIGAGGGFEERGAPDDQRDVDILLIELAAVAVVWMRPAHAFAVVA